MADIYFFGYEYENIPFVTASVVEIDAELSEDTLFAEAISSPSSSITSYESSPPYAIASPMDEDSYAISYFSHENEGGTRAEEGEPSEWPPSTPEAANDEHERQRTVGAGTAAAVLGFFAGGPMISLVLGVGAAIYTKKEGPAGDLARALGEVALVARDKFREVDSKHHIIDYSREAAQDAMHRIHEAERRYQGQQKLMRYAIWWCRATLRFVERHRLVERSCDHLKVAATLLAQKIHEHHRKIGNCQYRRQCQHQHYS